MSGLASIALAASMSHDALEFARSGDTLIVWKLDRLARSMKQLIETVENLRVSRVPEDFYRADVGRGFRPPGFA
jgi:hypothetical protein